jgi:hypothetical protein
MVKHGYVFLEGVCELGRMLRQAAWTGVKLYYFEYYVYMRTVDACVDWTDGREMFWSRMCLTYGNTKLSGVLFETDTCDTHNNTHGTCRKLDIERYFQKDRGMMVTLTF